MARYNVCPDERQAEASSLKPLPWSRSHLLLGLPTWSGSGGPGNTFLLPEPKPELALCPETLVLPGLPRWGLLRRCSKVPLITQAAYDGQARHERGHSPERFKESREETLPQFHFVPFTPRSFTPPPTLPQLLQMLPPSEASQVLCHPAQSPSALISF